MRRRCQAVGSVRWATAPRPTHPKPRVGTDGEGRRNSARLCITVVRRASSPSLNHHPCVSEAPTERSSLHCSHTPSRLLFRLSAPAATQVNGALTPEALTERWARLGPRAACVRLSPPSFISRGTKNLPGGVTKGQARGAQRPREHRPSAVRVQSATSSHARGSSPSACRARRSAARRAFTMKAACSFPKSRGRGGAGGSRWITKPPDWG